MSGGDWKDMYSAVQSGDLDRVRYHIENGVNPNYQHPEILSTPLVTAIVAGHTDVALYLLGHKADPNLRSYFDDLSPVEAANRHRNQDVLKRLKELGASAPRSWLRQMISRLPYGD